MEIPLYQQLPLTDDTLHRWAEVGTIYQIYPTPRGWPFLFGPEGQEALRECVRLRNRNDRLETALQAIVPKLIDALRNAADVDASDVYEVLAVAGVIQHVIYDPSQHGEIEDAEIGSEVWIFTDFGDQFAEAKVGEPHGGDTILGGDPILASLEAAAALCREAGCICRSLYIANYGPDLSDYVSPSEGAPHYEECPDALATRIEALALGKEE